MTQKHLEGEKNHQKWGSEWASKTVFILFLSIFPQAKSMSELSDPWQSKTQVQSTHVKAKTIWENSVDVQELL